MSLVLDQLDRAKAARTQAVLTAHTEARQEAVARHYASLARLSMDLLEATQLRRYAAGDKKKELTDFINYMVTQIENAHIHDFGVAPAWVYREP